MSDTKCQRNNMNVLWALISAELKWISKNIGFHMHSLSSPIMNHCSKLLQSVRTHQMHWTNSREPMNKKHQGFKCQLHKLPNKTNTKSVVSSTQRRFILHLHLPTRGFLSGISCLRKFLLTHRALPNGAEDQGYKQHNDQLVSPWAVDLSWCDGMRSFTKWLTFQIWFIHCIHLLPANGFTLKWFSSMLASLFEGPVKWRKGLSQIDKNGFGKRAVIKYVTIFVSTHSSWLVGA